MSPDLQAELERLRAENASLRAALDDRAAVRRLGEALSTIAARLGPLPDAELDAAIEEALGVVARVIDADRAVVVIFGRVGGYQRTHVWRAEGTPAFVGPAAVDTRDPFRALITTRAPFLFARGAPPAGSPAEALLARTGAAAVAVTPIYAGARAMGVVAFESMTEGYSLPPPVLGMLRTVGDLFGNFVVRMRQDADWRKLVDCLLAFGANPRDNIQRLTELVGELLGGDAALYSRLEGGRLHTWGRWRVPDVVPVTMELDGHLCAEVLRVGGSEVMVVRDLASSTFAETDPNVRAAGLATYVARAVVLGEGAVGALSVVYRDDYDPTPNERGLLGAIANAVAAEELRERALAALVHSEEAARVVFEHSLDGILLSGGPGIGVEVANSAACRMFGFEAHELRGLTRYDLIDDPARMAAFIAERDATGSARAELLYRRKDGSRFTADVSSTVVDMPGVGRRNVIVFRDATDRIRAAEKLDRIRRLLAATLDSTADGILAVDAERRAVCHNRRFLAMWQIPDELASTGDERRMLGHVIGQLADPEAFVARVEALSADPDAEALDVIELADGRTFERYSIPLHLDGERAGRVWSFRDISERVRDKKREHELEQEMRQAQKMEAVGRLAGGIAHDFNNLLTVISGYAAFLREALPEGDALRADVVEIEQAARRAAALTRQLLAFSRRQVLMPKVLELNGVVQAMESMLRRLLGEDIDVRTSLDEALWPVKADPNQLEQVLVNLAVNARDAMPGGGVLRIATQNVLLDRATSGPDGVPPGLYVRLDVGDTGHGMDEATRVRAFEPFFTTKEVGKGTGLGLSTVYGIVRQSGGAIDVESAPQQGTVFRILLPAVTTSPEETPASPTRASTLSGTETILLVEDEEPVRRVAQKALAGAGYQVLEARDGGEALELVEQRQGAIDLVVTDIVMPRMGGFELAEAIAARHPETPVLFVSGHVDIGGTGRAPPPGAVLLEKPFRPEALLERVRALLDG
jgi:PAS domain S-box-containing protein